MYNPPIHCVHGYSIFPPHHLESGQARARVGPQDKQLITHCGPPTLLAVAPITRRFTKISPPPPLTSSGPRYFPSYPLLLALSGIDCLLCFISLKIKSNKNELLCTIIAFFSVFQKTVATSYLCCQLKYKYNKYHWNVGKIILISWFCQLSCRF